ncbi:DUF433 domain-containing protein [Candidatus Gottesmanbacteria bacterium]|nr:DUF433 domain-containing protein [Candidatus Gottesmanbacteria bacterium]
MKKYIVSDPQILSGVPVIAGTRIPVSRIVFLLKDGYTLEAIREEYPHISLKVLEAVIDEIAQNYGAQMA